MFWGIFEYTVHFTYCLHPANIVHIFSVYIIKLYWIQASNKGMMMMMMTVKTM